MSELRSSDKDCAASRWRHRAMFLVSREFTVSPVKRKFAGSFA